MRRRLSVPETLIASPSPSWVRDATWLVVAQGALYAVPLVTLPLLAHRLGAAAYGDVAAAMAWAQLAATVPAFGFAVTAPRALATAPSDAARRRIVSGTAAARVLLTLLAVGLVAASAPVVPRGVAALAAAAMAYVAGQGLAWGWAFEGTGRFRTSALLAMASRVPVPFGVFLLVRDAGDAPRVLFVFAAASLLETVVGAVLARRAGLLGRADRRDVARALQGGGSLFAGQVLAISYVAATGFWLRLAGLPAPDVGRYVMGEQVARAAAGLFHPVSRALLPRLAASSGAARRAWQRRSAGAAIVVGGMLSGGLFAGAGALPHVLGADFAASVGVLRALAPLPLLVALSQSLGMQPLLAVGRDRAVVVLFALGALVTVAAALIAAPRVGIGAMPAAVVGAEGAVVVAALLLRRRSRRRSA